MIPTAEARRIARPGRGIATALLASGGVALLMLRLTILGNPSAVTLLAAAYVILGLVFVAVPVEGREEHRLGAVVVVAIGGVGLATASVAGGPPLPVAHGPQALWLGSLAAVSEEAFFRRFLYGRLIGYGAPAAIGVSALLFALVHVPAYGVAVFWVDLGAGMLLSWQRWASGGWAAPAATHVAANILAVIR